LEDNLPRSHGKRASRKPKHVHYLSDENDSGNEKQSGVVKRKEDIPIPNPAPKKISRGERFLVLLMAPNDGPSRIHGLHGKKLM
jgi:hypothetical protein